MNARLLLLPLLLAMPLAAQNDYVPTAEAVHPGLRVTIPNLPRTSAPEASSAEAARAALAIALGAAQVKCDPDSQVNSAIDNNAASSLRVLSNKIAGSYCEDNGRMVRLASSFVPNSAIQADNLIASMRGGQPLLLGWKNAVYVVHGVIYDEHVYSDGRRVNFIRELLLIDPRYSGKQRLTSFIREKENFAEVEGVATVSVAK